MHRHQHTTVWVWIEDLSAAAAPNTHLLLPMLLPPGGLWRALAVPATVTAATFADAAVAVAATMSSMRATIAAIGVAGEHTQGA
jgi:hypothetical protein